MKTKMYALVALVFFLLLGLTGPVKSAVTMTDITRSEFDAFAANTTTVSWSITLYPGASGGIFFPEVRVYRSDGTSVLLNHDWHKPEQIVLSYNAAGKLSLGVGSTIADIYPLLGVNALAFQIKDDSVGPTVLEGNLFNGVSVRNLFADDPSEMNVTYDQVLVTGFSDTFEYSGALDMGRDGLSGGTSSYLKIIGFTVPEPSSAILLFFGALIFARRKR